MISSVGHRLNISRWRRPIVWVIGYVRCVRYPNTHTALEAADLDLSFVLRISEADV